MQLAMQLLHVFFVTATGTHVEYFHQLCHNIQLYVASQLHQLTLIDMQGTGTQLQLYYMGSWFSYPVTLGWICGRAKLRQGSSYRSNLFNNFNGSFNIASQLQLDNIVISDGHAVASQIASLQQCQLRVHGSVGNEDVNGVAVPIASQHMHVRISTT